MGINQYLLWCRVTGDTLKQQIATLFAQLAGRDIKSLQVQA